MPGLLRYDDPLRTCHQKSFGSTSGGAVRSRTVTRGFKGYNKPLLGYIGHEKLPSYIGIIINHELGGGTANIFGIFSLFGEDFLFNEHIFQIGWFNHQLVKIREDVKGIGGTKTLLRCSMIYRVYSVHIYL